MLTSGIYLSRGLAFMAKSMQDFWKIGVVNTTFLGEIIPFYLIFVDFCLLKLCFSLLLKGNDDQGHEDVYEKEWKNDEVNDVENGHFDTVNRYRPLVFVGNSH